MTKKELKARANHLADAVKAKVIVAGAKLLVAILTPTLPIGKGRI
jgi:hypothetical protein